MILIEGLCKSFGTKPIIDDISYHFPAGQRLALVGANGAGKSTLLNIMAGLEEADQGRIIRPGDLSLGYLPQEPNNAPASTILEETMRGHFELHALKMLLDAATLKMNTDTSDEVISEFDEAESAFRLQDGYALSGRAARILQGLGFPENQLEVNPLDLSGGWRMRVELARLLLRSPDFLILDEPTNHLDLPSLIYVENFLLSFKGTLLFVSHDRSLLDRLAQRTLFLSQGALFEYVGNYTSFVAQHELREEQLDAQRQKIEQRRDEMERFVTRFGAKATKAAQAQSRVKMIARLDKMAAALPQQQKAKTLKFRFPEPPKTGRVVLTLEELAIGYNEPLTEEIALEMERGWRLAVVGANGLGKSTLLKTIAQQRAPLGGSCRLGYHVELSYFTQDQRDSFSAEATLLENISERCKLDPNQARALLGMFLFSGDDVDKPFQVLSGGEKSRVGLASILASRANLILLDEPTNHLDMTSIATLSEALSSFSANIMFVSHDREFIRNVATHVLVLLPGKRHFLVHGGLDDALAKAAKLGYPDFASQQQNESKQTSTLEAETTQDKSKLGFREAKEMKKKQRQLERVKEKLEGEQDQLKKDLTRLEAAMLTTDPLDHDRLVSLQQQLDENRAKLLAAEEKWLEVAMDLESLN